jgi:hypothetical protein
MTSLACGWVRGHRIIDVIEPGPDACTWGPETAGETLRGFSGEA